MKKVVDSYYRGQSGEPVHAEAGKIARISHKLGVRSMNAMARYNQQLEDAKAAKLEAAINDAQGLNKQVLELHKKVIALPGAPGASHDRLDEKGNLKEHIWLTTIEFGADMDPARPSIMTPLVEPIGSIILDVGPTTMQEIAVTSALIVSRALYNTDGALGPCETSLSFNQRDVEDKYRDFSYNDAEVNGEVNLSVSQNGNVSEVRIGRRNGAVTDGNTVTAQGDLEAFLENATRAVDATTQAYNFEI